MNSLLPRPLHHTPPTNKHYHPPPETHYRDRIYMEWTLSKWVHLSHSRAISADIIIRISLQMSFLSVSMSASV